MHQTLLIDKDEFVDKIIKTEEPSIDKKSITQIIDDSKYQEDLLSILEELDDIEQEY